MCNIQKAKYYHIILPVRLGVGLAEPGLGLISSGLINITDSITPTIRDNLHWLLVRQRVDFKICLLVYKLQVSSPARSVPHVNDHSIFGSLYTSPFALGRSTRLGCAVLLASVHETSQSLVHQRGTVCCW